jgi:ribosomal protein S18 acetylase RimI-like enzyme
MLSDAFLAAVDPAGRLALWQQLLDRPEPAEAWVACDDGVVGGRAASLWVAADNRKAVGFYTRLGFTPDGAEDTIADWEGLREIRMVRPAQPAA